MCRPQYTCRLINSKRPECLDIIVYGEKGATLALFPIRSCWCCWCCFWRIVLFASTSKTSRYRHKHTTLSHLPFLAINFKLPFYLHICIRVAQNWKMYAAWDIGYSTRKHQTWANNKIGASAYTFQFFIEPIDTKWDFPSCSETGSMLFWAAEFKSILIFCLGGFLAL